MPDIDVETKTRLRGTGRTSADLARCLGVTDHNLFSMLNGYRWPDSELQRKIEKQLKAWEAEINEQSQRRSSDICTEDI